ncbi:non-hydrolyzing UDP-N-acetylglucosamine 2-epimerase [Rickettsia endosymbiont of Orchestes rusci]|uniref:non-hydrolyzing UDP-N-acetylglucosamine 2-epimerase n=1 Tax=Rickettsia endosymbiont of Orchestes rusci TaxID=3066250 RepID=UPI00209DCAD3|nr:UDP-N-acetylglucosamine 2-epimerase (non-hydrolyzing) [Rickettsia endosymbiont of Ceutorhynchus assimilis]
MTKKLLFIFGTRPEAIKMTPLIKKSQKNKNFETIVCVTAQHREMLDQVLNFFEIIPNYDLNLMLPNQDLSDLTSNAINKLKSVITEVKPDLILVQGDTTTAFIGALSAFYHKVPVAHIEAGLRSGDKFSPYPEEMYRTLTADLAEYHFVPTGNSKLNLQKENIKNNIYVTGSTVIDALLLGLGLIKNSGEEKYYDYFRFLDFSKKIILITMHRRESFGKPLENICVALELLAAKYRDVQFVYPVHPNPNVENIVNNRLANIKNIFLISPLDYSFMIWLMEKAYIIITDSGGLQEEAPTLGKPLLVTRDVTERMEGVTAGTAKLVGTNIENILNETTKLLDNNDYYKTMAETHNPYGDGKATEYIMKILTKELSINESINLNT